MRISDWSSDVCSSDLVLLLEEHAQCVCIVGLHDRDQFPTLRAELVELGLRALGELAAEQLIGQFHHFVLPAFAHGLLSFFPRSEEHTSELQSLMRISYAVFCLKKKNNIKYKKQQPSYRETIQPLTNCCII